MDLPELYKKRCDYTLYGTAFDLYHMEEYVNFVINCLKDFPSDVGIAFRGVSGMLVGIRVADRTGREYTIIRKPGESMHSPWRIEGWRPAQYVIIDDFVSSGDTIKAIVKEMKGIDSECIGIILYNGHELTGWDPPDYVKNLKMEGGLQVPIYSIRG